MATLHNTIDINQPAEHVFWYCSDLCNELDWNPPRLRSPAGSDGPRKDAVTPGELKAHARRMVEEVLNQGDLAVIDDLVAPGCVHHVPGDPPPPGAAPVRALVSNLRRAFPDLHGIVDDEVVDGDRVVQRITCRGTHTGTLFVFPPSGRALGWALVAAAADQHTKQTDPTKADDLR